MAVSSLFNVEWYLSNNPDVRAAVEAGLVDAETHFQLHGRFEGRSPSPTFDAAYYLEKNPDVKAAVEAGLVTAYDHFLLHGMSEGRPFVPFFDVDYYLDRNPDVREAVGDDAEMAITHFLLHGQAETRAFSPFFDLAAYLDANPDVKVAVEDGASPLAHLLLHGFAEGRPLGNGISLAQFASDPTFKDAANPLEALARVAEVAPFLPSFQPPAGWKVPEDTPLPKGFVPTEGQKLVVPPTVKVPDGTKLPDAFEPGAPSPLPTPEPGTGSDSGSGTNATFTVTPKDSVITFAGTATGDIKVTVAADGSITFERGGIKQTLTSEEARSASAFKTADKFNADATFKYFFDLHGGRQLAAIADLIENAKLTPGTVTDLFEHLVAFRTAVQVAMDAAEGGELSVSLLKAVADKLEPLNGKTLSGEVLDHGAVSAAVDQFAGLSATMQQAILTQVQTGSYPSFSQLLLAFEPAALDGALAAVNSADAATLAVIAKDIFQYATGDAVAQFEALDAGRKPAVFTDMVANRPENGFADVQDVTDLFADLVAFRTAVQVAMDAAEGGELSVSLLKAVADKLEPLNGKTLSGEVLDHGAVSAAVDQFAGLSATMQQAILTQVQTGSYPSFSQLLLAFEPAALDGALAAVNSADAATLAVIAKDIFQYATGDAVAQFEALDAGRKPAVFTDMVANRPENGFADVQDVTDLFADLVAFRTAVQVAMDAAEGGELSVSLLKAVADKLEPLNGKTLSGEVLDHGAVSAAVDQFAGLSATMQQAILTQVQTGSYPSFSQLLLAFEPAALDGALAAVNSADAATLAVIAKDIFQYATGDAVAQFEALDAGRKPAVFTDMVANRPENGFADVQDVTDLFADLVAFRTAVQVAMDAAEGGELSVSLLKAVADKLEPLNGKTLSGEVLDHGAVSAAVDQFAGLSATMQQAILTQVQTGSYPSFSQLLLAFEPAALDGALAAVNSADAATLAVIAKDIFQYATGDAVAQFEALDAGRKPAVFADMVANRPENGFADVQDVTDLFADLVAFRTAVQVAMDAAEGGELSVSLLKAVADKLEPLNGKTLSGEVLDHGAVSAAVDQFAGLSATMQQAILTQVQTGSYPSFSQLLLAFEPAALDGALAAVNSADAATLAVIAKDIFQYATGDAVAQFEALDAGRKPAVFTDMVANRPENGFADVQDVTDLFADLVAFRTAVQVAMDAAEGGELSVSLLKAVADKLEPLNGKTLSGEVLDHGAVSAAVDQFAGLSATMQQAILTQVQTGSYPSFSQLLLAFEPAALDGALAAVNSADAATLAVIAKDIFQYATGDAVAQFEALDVGRQPAVFTDMVANRPENGFADVQDVTDLFADLVAFRTAVQVAMNAADAGGLSVALLEAVADKLEPLHDKTLSGEVLDHGAVVDAMDQFKGLSPAMQQAILDEVQTGSYPSFSQLLLAFEPAALDGALAAVNGADAAGLAVIAKDIFQYATGDAVEQFEALDVGRQPAVFTDMVANRPENGFADVQDVTDLFADLVAFRTAVQVAMNAADAGGLSVALLEAVADKLEPLHDKTLSGEVLDHGAVVDAMDQFKGLSPAMQQAILDEVQTGAYPSFSQLLLAFAPAALEVALTAVNNADAAGLALVAQDIFQYATGDAVAQFEALDAGRKPAVFADMVANRPENGFADVQDVTDLFADLVAFRTAVQVAMDAADAGGLSVALLEEVADKLEPLHDKTLSGEVLDHGAVVDAMDQFKGLSPAMQQAILDEVQTGAYPSFSQLLLAFAPAALEVALTAVNNADAAGLALVAQDIFQYATGDAVAQFEALDAGRKPAVFADMVANRPENGFASVAAVTDLFEDLVAFRTAVQVAMNAADAGGLSGAHLQTVAVKLGTLGEKFVNGKKVTADHVADAQTGAAKLTTLERDAPIQFEALMKALSDAAGEGYSSFTNMVGVLRSLLENLDEAGPEDPGGPVPAFVVEYDNEEGIISFSGSESGDITVSLVMENDVPHVAFERGTSKGVDAEDNDIFPLLENTVINTEDVTLIPGANTVLVVGKDSQARVYDSVASAASDAQGGIVKVGGGIYSETIKLSGIDDAVKIVGVGDDIVLDATSAAYAVDVPKGSTHTGDITIDNVTVLAGSRGGIVQGYGREDTGSLTVVNSVIKPTDLSYTGAGNAILVSGAGSVIEANQIVMTDYIKAVGNWSTSGVAVFDFASQTRIEGNSIEIAEGGLTPNNSVTGVGLDAKYEGDLTGIVVSNNQLVGLSTGVSSMDRVIGTELTDNVFNDNKTAISFGTTRDGWIDKFGATLIEGNTFSENDVSIRFSDIEGNSQFTIRDNIFSSQSDMEGAIYFDGQVFVSTLVKIDVTQFSLEGDKLADGVVTSTANWLAAAIERIDVEQDSDTATVVWMEGLTVGLEIQLTGVSGFQSTELLELFGVIDS